MNHTNVPLSAEGSFNFRPGEKWIGVMFSTETKAQAAGESVKNNRAQQGAQADAVTRRRRFAVLSVAGAA